MPTRPGKNQFTMSGAFLVALVLLWVIQLLLVRPTGPRVVPYSVFLTELRAGHIERAEIDPDRIVSVLKPGVPAPDTTGSTATGSHTSQTPVSIAATRLPGIDDTA